MKVTILQIDIVWGCPQKNIEQAQLLIDNHPGSDLYVLPEMWSTGFATQPDDIAEAEEKSVSLAWMRSTARQQHCAISGSLAVRTADDCGVSRFPLVVAHVLRPAFSAMEPIF